MTPMLDRVARAMCAADHVDPDESLCPMGRGQPMRMWETRVPAARAAVEAMREAVSTRTLQGWEAGKPPTLWPTVWRAMCLVAVGMREPA